MARRKKGENPAGEAFNPSQDRPEYASGRRLFIVTLIAVLAFFWWLLIHSGGVSAPHG